MCNTFRIYFCFFLWGSYFIFFFDILSFGPLIFLLGHTLFSFFNMGKHLQKEKYVQYYKTLTYSNQNYYPYYYRTLTVAPLGDGISWWNVKNFKINGLGTLTLLSLKLISELSFIHTYDFIPFKDWGLLFGLQLCKINIQ